MRSIIAGFAFALAAMLAGAAPASAAWTCDGPAYVCGGSTGYTSHKARVSYDQPRHYRSQRYAQAPVRSKTRVASTYRSRPRVATRSYGSEGGGYSGGSGMASYYSEGQMTASGARFNPGALTAAHRSLPFGTRVLVTNRSNGQSVVVIINDRGPFVGGRVIDLSRAAAQQINMTGAGVAPVSLQVLGRG
jgi:rare lipoprotein A